jgi:hypothetical protein
MEKNHTPVDPTRRQDTADFVSGLISRSHKHQAAISRETGLLNNSNSLSLFKSGRSAFPLKRSLLFARACGASEAETLQLISLCIRDTHPDLELILEYLSEFKCPPELLTLMAIAMDELRAAREGGSRQNSERHYFKIDSGAERSFRTFIKPLIAVDAVV